MPPDFVSGLEFALESSVGDSKEAADGLQPSLVSRMATQKIAETLRIELEPGTNDLRVGIDPAVSPLAAEREFPSDSIIPRARDFRLPPQPRTGFARDRLAQDL
jgi:hypothetical protein